MNIRGKKSLPQEAIRAYPCQSVEKTNSAGSHPDENTNHNLSAVAKTNKKIKHKTKNTCFKNQIQNFPTFEF